jgi:PIN domain nuclease of toxin-antitoxin system
LLALPIPTRPLWHLFDDKRLSAAAEAFINNAATARRKIAISTMSLAEVVYLVEKNRLPPSAYDGLAQALSFDSAQRGKHLRSGVPNVFVSFLDS